MDGLDHDPTAVERTLRLLMRPGDVFEIRALSAVKWKGMQGFFDDPALAANYVHKLSDTYKGVYVTLNPLNADVIHRASNRLKQAEEGLGAFDAEVIRRRWLPLDFDPIRARGVSATASEHAAALKLAKKVADVLSLAWGFPDPIIASSGNGAHLLYAIDLPNDDATRDAIQAFIKAVKEAFQTKAVDIDTSVFNASRIWRLYGTVARKGDSTLERPHRLSKILDAPDWRENTPIEAIRAFTAKHGVTPAPGAKSGQSLYDRAYPEDEGRWRVLNRLALEKIDRWVPGAFQEAARPYKQGYRVSSALLGRDREEDLTIHPWPWGIKDFGEHDSGEAAQGKRTPVSVLAEWIYDDDKVTAAKWLAEALDTTESEFAKVASKEHNDEFDKVFKGSAGAAKLFDFRSIRSAEHLKQTKFKELNWLIDGMLPEGAFIFSSRPKMRKSFLALQLSIAVATGGEIFGRKCSEGEVLALMLEDNDRRMKRRLELLFTFKTVPDLSKLHFWTPGGMDFEHSFPRGVDGAEVIDKWLTEHPKCKLVIIDTFAHFRGHETGRSQNVYQLDYEAVMPLTRIAAKHGITLIIIHHERKGSDKNGLDFIEDTSGSTGLTGGVDGIMSIKGKRGPSEENETRVFALTGRDVPNDFFFNISFDAETGGWRLAKQQDVAQDILSLLRKYPVLKLSEIYSSLPNTNQSRIRQVLLDLRHEGRVENTAHGYRLPGV